jgi:hypothetical protein
MNDASHSGALEEQWPRLVTAPPIEEHIQAVCLLFPMLQTLNLHIVPKATILKQMKLAEEGITALPMSDVKTTLVAMMKSTQAAIKAITQTMEANMQPFKDMAKSVHQMCDTLHLLLSMGRAAEGAPAPDTNHQWCGRKDERHCQGVQIITADSGRSGG